MKKIITRVTAVVLAITMLGTQMESNTIVAQATKKAVKVGNGVYTVTSEKKKTARFDKMAKKSVKTLYIPSIVMIGNKNYKVTAVKVNALKGNKKIRKLIIRKNVVKIGKKAFYGCKNLKSITIQTTKLTAKSVGANAFGGLNSKVQIKVPASKASAYQTLLKKKGVTGKDQVISSSGKAAAEKEEEKKPTVIPEPEVRFAIGELESGVKDPWVKTKTEAEYEVGDNIRFTMWAKMPLELYGSWSVKETKVTHYLKCSGCGKLFAKEYDLAMHFAQESQCGAYWIYDCTQKTIDAWYWTENETPCKVIYHATLPEGLTIIHNSIEVWRNSFEQVNASDGKYDVKISNQDITVTINDIKPYPYRTKTSNGTTSTVIYPIIVKFTARLNDSASTVNQVNANITYNYGSGDKVANMNPVTIKRKE